MGVAEGRGEPPELALPELVLPELTLPELALPELALPEEVVLPLAEAFTEPPHASKDRVRTESAKLAGRSAPVPVHTRATRIPMRFLWPTVADSVRAVVLAPMSAMWTALPSALR